MNSLPLTTPSVAADSTQRQRELYRDRRKARETMLRRRVETTVQKQRDILWQQNPDRVLKYRPYHLHYYGWIPLSVWRNLKATVFSELYLHIQCLLLILWMLCIHVWGIGVSDDDLATIIAMFGAPYVGAIFNFSMVVTFILGLFITLVINRWWSIRAAHTKLMGTTTELCMSVASSIQNLEDQHDGRIYRAKTELTRLLNLGHLLVIGRAEDLNRDFREANGLKTLYRKAMKKNGGTQTACFISVSEARNRTDSSVAAQTFSRPQELLARDTMVNEGLMNRDEWEILLEAEKDGLPKHHMVYYWVKSLINKCRVEECILHSHQTVPSMLNKINIIVESGSSILTTISSQMPYPYVHLVSFVVHMYLIVLSTWFGCFLHTGRVGEVFVMESGEMVKRYDDDIKTSVWMIFWCYFYMVIANTTFQGLLDMHTLLDNPFGNHCAKFPIRASVSYVTNATRTMLNMSDVLPAAFEDIFKYRPDADSVWSSSPVASQEPAFANFLRPTPTGQLYQTSAAAAHQSDCSVGAVNRRGWIDSVGSAPVEPSGSRLSTINPTFEDNVPNFSTRQTLSTVMSGSRVPEQGTQSQVAGETTLSLTRFSPPESPSRQRLPSTPTTDSGQDANLSSNNPDLDTNPLERRPPLETV